MISDAERLRWIHFAVGIVLPILWGVGYTTFLMATNQESVSAGVRALSPQYPIMPVILTAFAVGLIFHFWGSPS